MTRWPLAVALALVCVFAATSAQARHRHHHHRHHMARADSGATVEAGGVVGGRPAGCPHAFCGCEASRYIFGRIIPDLNLAANWIRKFPRTSPQSGMVAARNHHVMVLMRHVEGSEWLVHDGNGGRHKTWEHVRSIAGYVVVDPHGSRMASR